MARLSATDASRGFSEVLNRVLGGERIEVTRGGTAVAVISAPTTQYVSAARFRELIQTAPTPDGEFVEDVRAARRALEAPASSWPS